MTNPNEIDIIRHESIRIAVEALAGRRPKSIMEFAKEIEAFLRGPPQVQRTWSTTE